MGINRKLQGKRLGMMFTEWFQEVFKKGGLD